MFRKIEILILIFALYGLSACTSKSGRCGDNLKWSFNTSTGKLIITGTGRMRAFTGERIINTSPWKDFASSITSLSLPNGITSIDHVAFAGCCGLTSIIIPNSVTWIGQSAFSDCNSLKNIVLEDGTETLLSRRNAFYNCPIESLYIGRNINDYDAITRFYVGKELYSEDVLYYPPFNDKQSITSVTISNSVITINDDAFSGCSGLTSVSISNSVTKIGNNAFKGCSGITSISISDSLTEIGSGAFDECNGLSTINVTPDNPSYSSIDGILYNKQQTELILYPRAKTGTITIPNSVIKLSSNDFKGCSNLTSINVTSDNPSYCSIDGILYNKEQTDLIRCPEGKTGALTIPNSVYDINYDAFKGCSGLTSVTVPKPGINLDALKDCSGLTTINVSSHNSDYSSIDGILYYQTYLLLWCPRGKTGTLTIPNSVILIDFDAFKDCNSLSSITIPNSVTKIGWRAFSGCSGLTSITIPNSVTEIDQRAFEGCSGLSSVTIPNSVDRIYGDTFSGCSGLTSITIPNSVTEIGYGAFSGCVGLTSLIIPNSVTEIGSGAFSNCSSLASLTIPNSVTEIDYGAFSGCVGLTSLIIPNSVTEIGSSAFEGCSNLTSIVCKAINPPKMNYDSFRNIGKNAKFYVSCESKNKYKTDEYWKGFNYGKCLK